MSGIRDGSTQDTVYAALRRRVLDGTYAPGYRLVIDAIAREFEVSATPVREAIRRLEAERWVVHQRNVGAQVAPRDPESWAEAIEVLALVDGYVSARAAPYMTVEDFKTMRAICEEERGDVDSWDVIALTEHNMAFHRVIWERCPNRVLRREVEAAQERLDATRSTIYFPLETRGHSSIDEHFELIAMLEARRSAGEIERFVRRHRMRTISARRRRSSKKKDV